MDLPETCEDVEAALPLFVGTDLEPAEMDAVRFHLEGCEACSALARRAAAARGVLVGARRESSVDGPSLWDGIRPALLAEGLIASTPQADALESPRPTRQRMTSLQRFGIGSAAAAAAVLFAFTLAGQLRPDAPDVLPTVPGAGSEHASTIAVSHPAPAPAAAVAPSRPAGFPGAAEGWQQLRAAGSGEEHMVDVAGDFLKAHPPSVDGPALGNQLTHGQ